MPVRLRFGVVGPDAIAGVMLLSEVAQRLMMMSGLDASTSAAGYGQAATSRMNEVVTTYAYDEGCSDGYWSYTHANGLSALLNLMPKITRQIRTDSSEEDIRLNEVRVGDHLRACVRAKRYRSMAPWKMGVVGRRVAGPGGPCQSKNQSARGDRRNAQSIREPGHSIHPATIVDVLA